MIGMETDYTRVAQAVLVRALHDAEKARTKRERQLARRWLIATPNEFRELLLTTTNLCQNDLDRFVKGLK